MSEQKQTYLINMFSLGGAVAIELTEAEFKAKCSEVIRSYLATGRTEEVTRNLVEERKVWAQQVDYADGVARPADTRFEDEILRQLDSGEWKKPNHLHIVH